MLSGYKQSCSGLSNRFTNRRFKVMTAGPFHEDEKDKDK
jgi:hypothetical protein